eukprot:CAMPEP_0113548846 /NCGR_PEP_ID=MMETSP0015_2-20120614/13111_1 /TAXON_ID=2838 /ORGANISM="Odontella" /LENGTH=708 /DNA_ID=CAMNT_0000449503 /DNA_START=279 /DNA_END=2405 /DNA_ORIENTATION=- /assembly_acc=CAM_ASM_000160
MIVLTPISEASSSSVLSEKANLKQRLVARSKTPGAVAMRERSSSSTTFSEEAKEDKDVNSSDLFSERAQLKRCTYERAQVPRAIAGRKEMLSASASEEETTEEIPEAGGKNTQPSAMSNECSENALALTEGETKPSYDHQMISASIRHNAIDILNAELVVDDYFVDEQREEEMRRLREEKEQMQEELARRDREVVVAIPDANVAVISNGGSGEEGSSSAVGPVPEAQNVPFRKKKHTKDIAILAIGAIVVTLVALAATGKFTSSDDARQSSSSSSSQVKPERTQGANPGIGAADTSPSPSSDPPTSKPTPDPTPALTPQPTALSFPIPVACSDFARAREGAKPTSAPYAEYGMGVALSGDMALIGVPRSPARSRGAHVLVRRDEVWTMEARLITSHNDFNHGFGNSVALDRDTALIGAPWENGTGLAYIYRKSEFDGKTEWVQEAKLVASGGLPNDMLGMTLALHGNTALVGGPRKDSGKTGQVYVFFRGSDGTWEEQAKLVPDDGLEGKQLGHSVALFGDRALVGATFDNGWCGAAYVFIRGNDGSWAQEAKFAAPNCDGTEYSFGTSVALDGESAIVGVSGADYGNNDGTVYFYSMKNGAFEQEAKANRRVGGFGKSVAISGDMALVGAGIDRGMSCGSVFRFARKDGEWKEEEIIAANTTIGPDRFGDSISLSGDTLLVGAPWDHDSGDHARSGSSYFIDLECEN